MHSRAHVRRRPAGGRLFEYLPARRKVDAVVVVGLPVDTPERKRLELMGVHVLAVGAQSAAFPFVRIDDQVASRQAVDHLVSLGHRCSAMIEAIDPDAPEWPREIPRSRGYYEVLDDAGFAVCSDLVVRIPWGGEAGAAAMGGLLRLRHPPTAVFAHSDEIALGAMRTVRRAGLRIPEDVSIIGIDDHPLAAFTDLTTVGQPTTGLGSAAARMLLDLLAGLETAIERHPPYGSRRTAQYRRAAQLRTFVVTDSDPVSPPIPCHHRPRAIPDPV